MNKVLGSSYKLDHIGIAVKSLDEASQAYFSLGWTEAHTEAVPSEKVRVRMFELANNCRIELIEPTSSDSTIARFLEKRGPGIHHYCLSVNSIDEVLQKLKSEGIRLIHETPFQGAHNCRVAFIHPQSMGGVLVELSEPGGTG